MDTNKKMQRLRVGLQTPGNLFAEINKAPRSVCGLNSRSFPKRQGIFPKPRIDGLLANGGNRTSDGGRGPLTGQAARDIEGSSDDNQQRENCVKIER
jgi:hypothetical protein